MSFLHKLGLFFAGLTFRTTLFFALTLLASVIVLTDRQLFKSALIESNAYDRFAQSLIDSGKEQGANDPNAIPLDDPQIQKIIKKSLDHKTLQKVSENVIDSSYAWLEGDTKNIEFSADLSANKEILARGVSDYAIERLVSLPVCTEIPPETNVFKIPCYPFNTDINLIRSQVYDTLIADQSIFKSTPITSDDFPKTSDGQPLTVAYAKAPMYYSWYKASPWLLLFLAAIAMVGVIYLDRTKRRGLHVVATSIIGTGIILMVAPILYTYILPATGLALPGASSSQNESVTAISNDVMKYVYKDFNTTLINIAIQVLVIGLVLLFISKFLLHKSSPYHGLRKKTGLSISIAENQHTGGVKISAKDVPVQSSEKPAKTKKKISSLEKKFQKL